MFGPILPTLAASHQVILPDLQGHGRTADIDRPIDVRLMADDIAALIDHLGLDRPDVVGYSLGGGVAFWTARQVPGARRQARDGLGAHPARRDPAEMLAQQGRSSAAAAEFMKDTPMYQLYLRVAPRPEDFGRLLDKIGASRWRRTSTSARRSAALQVPTLIVAADADMAPPSHYVEVFKLLEAACATAAGWARAGRRAATRWRSCPA